MKKEKNYWAEGLTYGLILGFIADVIIGTITFNNPCTPTPASNFFFGGICLGMSYYGLFLWFAITGALIGRKFSR